MHEIFKKWEHKFFLHDQSTRKLLYKYIGEQYEKNKNQ